jgi:hypothetical protein
MGVAASRRAAALSATKQQLAGWVIFAGEMEAFVALRLHGIKGGGATCLVLYAVRVRIPL